MFIPVTNILNFFGRKLPVLLGFLLLTITMGYFRISLYQYADHFAKEFEKQNVRELSNSDILSITNRLNSILTALPWVCIEADSNSKTFYSRQRGICTTGIFTQEVRIVSLPTHDIELKFVLSLPLDLKTNALVFILIQSSMLLMIIISQQKIDKLSYVNKVRIAELAEQVAHDIRSPLAALEMISSSFTELSEDRRTVLRNSINRIRDIANSLIMRNRPFNQKTESLSLLALTENVNREHGFADEYKIELLMPIIDSLVSEKRIQYRNHLQLQINFEQTTTSYGAFSKINPNIFKRALSNLIDNSVEAMEQQIGTINLNLHCGEIYNEINIQDNGAGIADAIINKLGDRGATFNKEGGSGLGLHQAKKTLEACGGSLNIKPESIGARIELLLPKAPSPLWFVPKLNIGKKTVIIIFDDDQTIHEIWKNKFSNFGNDPEVVNLSSPKSFRTYYKNNFQELEDAIFLMDYEIIGTEISGLTLIEEFGLQKQSILVTSRYEESQIRQRCERLNLRIIPKSMSLFVPVEFN